MDIILPIAGYVNCGPNEIISNCVNGGCGRWNCSQPGEICINLKDGACRKGCHCIDSYLRADNGTCIPANECPCKYFTLFIFALFSFVNDCLHLDLYGLWIRI